MSQTAVTSVFALAPDCGVDEEHVELLASGPDTTIERIVSRGQTTAPGSWYDQPRDEWVVLLQGAATLGYADGTRLDLRAGDAVHIAARVRHRVEATSTEPPCIWLAVHGRLSLPGAAP